jgi:hypothetical protein
MAKKSEAKKAVVPVTDDEFAKAADAILKTDEGRKFWVCLARRLGFFQSDLARLRDGSIESLSTEALAAQRNVYLGLRKLPTYELLAAAESLADPENPVNRNSQAQKPQEERKK